MKTQMVPGQSSNGRRVRVPRRGPKACQQCRTAKVRCSGVYPCVRCARRHDECHFPEDDPKVYISERYLIEIERRAAQALEFPPPTSDAQPMQISSPSSDHGEGQNQDSSESAIRWDNSPTMTGAETSESQNEKEDARAAEQPVVLSGADVAQVEADNGEPGVIFSSNPLVKDISHLKDPAGRYRFLGPTSMWSFFRRAVALAEKRQPLSQLTSPDIFGVDGDAFRLRWVPQPPEAVPDLENLPPVDYALCLFHTVKFHLGQFAQIIDEPTFLARLEAFDGKALEVAQTQRLWLTEYLLILAFGEAFTAQAGPALVPPGSNFAERALAVLPDFAQLHEEGLESIEVLALVALYFHSIDMRSSAYQYIGHALRLCYIEGIHREMSEQVFGPHLVQRCRTLWWNVYILDRRLSAQLGAPSSIRDEEITMGLPLTESGGSSTAVTLSLSVKLSRLLATIMTDVFSIDDRLGSAFVKTTNTVLKSLAEVAQEHDEIMLTRKQSTTPSRMMSSITLMYHHCILHATRPLVMCLFKAFVEPGKPDHGRDLSISPPIASLLKSAVSSALATLKLLTSLEKQRVLESFLPFDLEYAFASALSLCIIRTVLPHFVPDQSWFQKAVSLLDKMISQGGIVARLRKNELQRLEQLLIPLRSSGEPGNMDSTLLTIVPVPLPSDLVQEDQGFWDPAFDMEGINPDPVHLFDLALQLGLDPGGDVIGSL